MRLRAVRGLGRRGRKAGDPSPARRQVVQRLVAAFRSHAAVESHGVAEAAAAELHSLGETAVDRFVEIARDTDEDRSLRTTALKWLAASEEPTAHMALIGTLDDGKLGALAAELLGEARIAAAFEPLLKILETDPAQAKTLSGATPRSAAIGLGKLGDPRAAPALVAIATDPDREELLRKFSLEALGLLDWQADAGGARQTVESLLARLEWETWAQEGAARDAGALIATALEALRRIDPGWSSLPAAAGAVQVVLDLRIVPLLLLIDHEAAAQAVCRWLDHQAPHRKSRGDQGLVEEALERHARHLGDETLQAFATREDWAEEIVDTDPQGFASHRWESHRYHRLRELAKRELSRRGKELPAGSGSP